MDETVDWWYDDAMKVRIKNGQTLWEALREQNIELDRPCGGKGTCGQCAVEIANVGSVLSCRFSDAGEYEVSLIGQQSFDTVFAAFAWTGLSKRSGICAAVDLGTTTVAIALTDGTLCVRRQFVNPQRQYGADVVSRIEAANRGEGERLKTLIRDALLRELCEGVAKLDRRSEEGRPHREHGAKAVCRVAISGNTTMLHLLRGLSCEGLGKAPFRPVEMGFGQEQWERDGFCFAVTYLPGFSAYIGADIVSGLYALRMSKGDFWDTLFLDLGTNGEMALVTREGICCASAAAGPAFEGSALAMQIHAAGILHVTAELLKRDLMDGYGTLREPYRTEGILVGGLLDPKADDRRLPEELRITQDDIREIQMAKAAIRAGIEILLERTGRSAARVKAVYLAGGMGYYLDPKDAETIGLIPAFAHATVTVCGNTSLEGAKRYLASQQTVSDEKTEKNALADGINDVRQQMKEILLADDPTFADRYISFMNFPELPCGQGS